MNEAIRASAMSRGITRLCHFTPSRNLLHIATDRQGILSSVHLKEDEKAVVNVTDPARLDGFPDHVCCSIEYPNAWYLRMAGRRDGERLFPDWVILLLAPLHLWQPGTRFCSRNAAAGYGRGVAGGADAFEAMFDASVYGAGGRTYSRGASHPAWMPTDEQAEVLIPDQVRRQDVLGVAVVDASQAKREHARLTQLRAEVPPLIVAPDLFDPNRLSARVRTGKRPSETLFAPEETR